MADKLTPRKAARASSRPAQEAALSASLNAFVALQGANAKVAGRLAHRIGLGPIDLRALILIGRVEVATPRLVADYLELTTGAVTSLIDRLEHGDFIQRSAHPTDRRSTGLSLLPGGTHVVESVYHHYGTVFEQTFATADLVGVTEALTSLARALERSSTDLD